MKPYFTILSILFFGPMVSTQPLFQFESKIKHHEYYEFDGNIGGKYPIKMYLEHSFDYCGEGTNNRWRATGLKGWYYYEKIKKKIPLIGSYKKGDNNSFVKLYVPQNITDTINKNSCELLNYKEYFHGLDSQKFGDLTWSRPGRNSTMDTDLEIVHNFSYETEAMLVLKIRRLEMASFNLSKLTGVNLISDVEILTAKEIDNHFYTIIQFGHLTNPWSNGSGYCGVGWEGYLGFIHVNESFEIEQFDFFQTESCHKDILEDKYSYDSDFPEKGILIK